MLIGIVLLLSSVILLGLDGESVAVDHFPIVCQLRAWLLCLGFTLAFGAMFSKVWRVHRYVIRIRVLSAPHRAEIHNFFLLFLYSQSTKAKEEAKKIKEGANNPKKNVSFFFYFGMILTYEMVHVILLFIFPVFFFSGIDRLDSGCTGFCRYFGAHNLVHSRSSLQEIGKFSTGKSSGH